MLLLKCFLIILSLLSGSHGLIGYDCESQNANITAISLLSTHECLTQNGTITEEDMEGQIIQMHQYQPVHVFTCSVEVTIDVFYCGSLSHVFRTTHPTRSYIKHLGRTECEEAHKLGTLKVFNTKITNLKPNSSTTYSETVLGRTSDSGTCANGLKDEIFHMDDGTKIQQKVVQVSISVRMSDKEETLSIADQKIIIESMGLSCAAAEEYCKDTLIGEVFWNYKEEGCFNRVDVLYEGPMKVAKFLDTYGEMTTIISVQSKSKLFSLKLMGYSILCGGTVIDTEHKRIKISKQDELNLNKFTKTDLYNRNVDLQYYIDSKFLYVTSSLLRRTEDIYKSVMDSICLVQKQILENRLVLSQIRSDQVGQLIEKENGVTASILGEVMYLTSCEPVPVVFRKNAGCVQELPVFYKGKPMFLKPITHILTETGTETLCSKHMTPAFKLEDSWHGYNNELTRVILEPIRLNPNRKLQSWNFRSLLEISKSGLYDTEDLESLQRTMMFSTTREAIQNNVAKSLYSNGKTGSGGGSDFMDTSMIETIGGKIGGFAWFLTKWIGDVASILIGFIIIFKLFIFFVDTILNCCNIYHKKGCSPWLLCGWMSSVVHIIMHDIVFSPIKNFKDKINRKNDRQDLRKDILSVEMSHYDTCDEESNEVEDSNAPNAPLYEASQNYPDLEPLRRQESRDKHNASSSTVEYLRKLDEAAVHDAIIRDRMNYTDRKSVV